MELKKLDEGRGVKIFLAEGRKGEMGIQKKRRLASKSCQ